MSPKEIFDQRQDAWIVGLNHQAWLARIEQRQQALQKFTARDAYPRILLVQSDPLEFLAGFMAACLCECPVFLGNPSWQASEWQQVLALAQPHLIWGNSPLPEMDNPRLSQPLEQGWIMVPTGGSSGKIRFAIHTWSTLTASVRGCQRHFFGTELEAINSCCWLPLYHVSGLMQFMRSLLTHGHLLLLPQHSFDNNTPLAPAIADFVDPASIQPQQYFLSLVPTQLQRLLQQGNQRLAWLARFQTMLLGGAPAWPELLQLARQHHLRLALTYGMTETASQVATLDPEQFLLGETHTGQVLPHAQITIEDEHHQPLSPNQIGQVMIQSSSLCWGYYPHPFASSDKFSTDDLGYFNDQGDLHIVGRSSRKIISGGQNIYPEEIEDALLGTGMVKDATVLGQPHSEWGQIMIAVVVPKSAAFSLPALAMLLRNKLSSFKQPKQWLVLPTLPRNPQGKVDPILLNEAIQAYSQNQNGG